MRVQRTTRKRRVAGAENDARIGQIGIRNHTGGDQALRRGDQRRDEIGRAHV